MPTQERALLFVKILYHFTYGTGNRSQADFYLNVMQTLVQQPSAGPLDRILLSNFEAAYQYCFDGSPQRCYEHVDAALQLGEESGVLIWQSVSLSHALYMAWGQGDIPRAKKYIANFKQVIGINNAMHIAFDELFTGWLAMLQGRPSSALKHVDAGLMFLERNPVSMIRNLFLGGKAALLVQRGEWKQSWSILTEIRHYARHSRSNTLEIMVRLLQARWCLNRKCHAGARAFLQRARDSGVAQNIYVCPWLSPEQMPPLVGFALESGIDTVYFAQWVSLYSLKIPSSMLARDRWPWRIKIRTLGTLEIRLDNNVIESEGRAHKRLLEILGLLITAGQRGLPQDELISELWPDKNEERGRSNLNTNLARLRAFLGEPRAVLCTEGSVLINRDFCWVDSWEFLDDADLNGPVEIEKLTILESIYRGEYQVSETNCGAEMILRSTLVNRYLRIARSLARALEKNREFDRAIGIYRRMLSKLGPVEEIYRDLMFCLARVKRVQEIETVYQECCSVLSKKYGRGPSPDTTLCYQKFKNLA